MPVGRLRAVRVVVYTAAAVMNLALFDFDGTITRGDSWKPFLRSAVGPGRKALAYATLFPVAVGYYMKLVSGSTARPLFAYVAFRGTAAATVQHLGREYAKHVLPSTVRPRALEQIDWHQRQGDDVVVVSGSLSVYLRPWCEANGIRCIATELDECNGRLTGRYRRGECTGMEKARRISSQFDLSRYSEVYAYGDTSDDLEMLALAHRKYYRWKEISAPLDSAGAVRGRDVGHDAAAI